MSWQWTVIIVTVIWAIVLLSYLSHRETIMRLHIMREAARPRRTIFGEVERGTETGMETERTP